MMDKLISSFKRLYGHSPGTVCFAPGRVNLIGEHTDYNGGHVFPCALNMGITCAAALRDDDELHFYSQNVSSECEIIYDLDALAPRGCWADYPASVVRAFASFGRKLIRGADFYYKSDLPGGSGLSSSAALEVVTGTALRELYSIQVTLQEIALIGQFAENRFIGVNCGIMDQFASAMGKKDHAILLNANTLEFEYSPLADADVVIVNSGVKHSLASSAYNERRRECESAAGDMKVPYLCLLSAEEFEEKKHLIKSETCLRRAKHAVYENLRAASAAKALNAHDLRTFGALMNGSHASLKEDYQVSCKELDYLVKASQKLRYVYGARMTGGGFGGCTVNLMEKGYAESFEKYICSEYKKTFGTVPEVYTVSAGDGAKKLC